MGRKARLKRERRKLKLKTDWDEFIRRLPYLRRTILESGARRDSCILSTRVVCVLAQTLGFRAIPMTVEAIGMNKPLADYTREHGQAPDDSRMAEFAEKGARFIVLGARDDRIAEPGMWAGHLCALVSTEGHRVLIDLSADQADRPHKRIHLTGPLHVEVGRDWEKGEEMAALNLDEDGLMLWRAIPDDDTYTTSPDWTEDDRVSITLR